jgi:hypothetical protein
MVTGDTTLNPIKVLQLVVLAWLGGLFGAPRAAATSPAEGPDLLFGIQIGVPLERQFGECAAAESVFTAGAVPCWKRDRLGGRVVLLPRTWVAEIGAPARVERVREWDGVVVEIEVEFRYADRRRVESYLLKRKGKPVETETYEMDSRVAGLSKHSAHTWRGKGVTTHFVERTGGGHTRVRAFLDSWATMEADYQKQRGGG